MANVYWVLLMFFTVSLATPLAAQMEPPLNPSGSGDTFLYPPATVNGLPRWAFKIILIAAVPYIFLLVGIYKSPNVFPILIKKYNVIMNDDSDAAREQSAQEEEEASAEPMSFPSFSKYHNVYIY